MFRIAREALAARFTAALVMVALTGAPRVVALATPAEGHRCACKAHAAGHHECECAICRKVAHSARPAERVPPCHRAAARKPPAREDGREPVRERAHCLEGTCGNGTRAVTAVAGPEPFCPEAREELALPLAREVEARTPRPLTGRSPEPETPPPRGT